MVKLLKHALISARRLWNFVAMKNFDWSVDQGWNALMEGGTESYRFVRVSDHYRVLLQSIAFIKILKAKM